MRTTICFACLAAKILLAIAVWGFLLAVAMGAFRPAGAHDGAHWIMVGPYVDKNNVGCCGPQDCWPVAPEELYEDDKGLTYRGQRVLHGKPDGVHGGAYWSAEPDPPAKQRPWVCVRHGRLVCAFRPQPGS